MARVTIYGEVRRYVQLGESAFMDEKWNKATTFIAAHPKLELRLTRDRFVAMWLGTPHPFRDFSGVGLIPCENQSARQCRRRAGHASWDRRALDT